MHVICYNITPIPCAFVWGLRVDYLIIYIYNNFPQNWSLVHTIPYYRPQPLLLADGVHRFEPFKVFRSFI